MEFLLASMLTCADGKWILDGLAQSELTNSMRSELIVEILQAMPDDCADEQYRAGDRNP
jgi:hypothetical protein